MPSLEILQITWWGLLGFLIIGFALTSGLALGVTNLFTLLAKTSNERCLVLCAIQPTHKSNHLWLALTVGAIFTAWPLVFSIVFSTMWILILLGLFCFILRFVGLKFRNKKTSKCSNKLDFVICISSIMPCLIFGILIGNAILGLPFAFDENQIAHAESVFFGLFSQFSVLAGLVCLAMLTAHGAAYLRLKVKYPLAEKAHNIQKISSFLCLVFFASAGITLNNSCIGFTLESAFGSQDIFTKIVGMQFIMESDELAQRFFCSSAMIATMIAFFGFLISMVSGKQKPIVGFLGTSLSIIGIIATAGLATFPFVLPSTLAPNYSLTIWDCSSSRTTLFYAIIIFIILSPLILGYMAWVHKKFNKRLSLAKEEIQ